MTTLTEKTDRIHELVDRLAETPRMTFSSMFSDVEVGPAFRITVVVTFLAILEMAPDWRIEQIYPAEAAESYLADLGGPEGVSADIMIRMRPERWNSLDFSS